MSILRRLRALLGAGGGEGNALLFYVRCDRCAEVIRVRADRRWDLVEEFGDGVDGYSLHKDVLGMKCNHLMRMHITFDRRYVIMAREIEGGRFATQAEYSRQS